MPIVIILMLIFLILIVHVGYLTLRNRQLERRKRDDAERNHDDHQE